VKIPPNELNHARKRLMLGGSLMQAATDIGVGRDELDLELWRYATRRGYSANPAVRRSYLRRVS
jgi:hypothetical protein